jgi:hypothetical protein
METETPHLPVNPSVHLGTFTQPEADERDRLKRIEEKLTESAGSRAAAALEEARLRADEAARIAEAAEHEFEILLGRKSSLGQRIEGAKRLLEWCDFQLANDPRKRMEEGLDLCETFSPMDDPSTTARIDNYLGALTHFEAKYEYFSALKKRWEPRLAELEKELAQVEAELLPKESKKK